MSPDDAPFLTEVTDALASLPSVEAVALGGSRARGTHRPDSDWDVGIYYRGAFDPEHLRRLGWPGTVSDLGGWGGGVFNGGAWLMVGERRVDVHYRDLDVVEAELARAERGEFGIEPLMFHLAGIPTYLVVGELAGNRVLHGSLPSPGYPEALRRSAPAVWADRAALHLSYAESGAARHGRLTQCAGLMAVAAVEYAHAVLAARGEWTTNEKDLLDRAGLRAADGILASLHSEPSSLLAAVAEMRELGRTALSQA
ncbi:nucleotidyltransferase domain-containing protein [Naasia sp. SYSU D00057]|uniref:nucleotidyltransferase domain-containing protein n=1 Tax=Naasia sp. SYSU D00057 TaxID=2817380 RepID=UPI001B316C1D|nr:nucleotidyltransferase domain-containing protein [Naasia sp. SYSU D00057]